MSLAYIRKTYGVPAKRGARVRYAPPILNPIDGSVVGSRHGLLRVKFDAFRKTVLLHPEWCLEYIDAGKEES